jgi:tetratricopeptide (TPR) repeat protein
VLDELAVGWPPGAADLGRAALLAMLGRTDEAWPLAEARSNHLRDVTGGSIAGLEHLALIASVEGDRQRACRYHAELIDTFPRGIDAVAASYRLLLARDLCHLGRLEEAEPLLRQAQSVRPGPFERSLGSAIEALLLSARGDFEQAEAKVRGGITVAEAETESPWLQAWGYEDLATVLERAGRIDDARAALERALDVAERKRCLPYASRLGAKIDSLARTEV